MHARPRRLYDFPFSGNGYKIRLALAQLGLDVAYEIVDILAGEAKTAAFLARNPLGEIPVLELEDGTFLRESNAILYWLSEDTPLMVRTRLERARLIQWFIFEQNHIDKVLGRTRFLRRYPDYRKTEASEWDGWSAAGNQALAIVDAELSDRRFLVGDSYSVADICLYGYVHCAEEGGFDLGRYRAVSAWLDQVRRQPGHITIDDLP